MIYFFEIGFVAAPAPVFAHLPWSKRGAHLAAGRFAARGARRISEIADSAVRGTLTDCSTQGSDHLAANTPAPQAPGSIPTLASRIIA